MIANALLVLNQEPARIGEVMDVDTLLTYFAVSAIVSNTDGFTGPFEVDDHFQYYDPTTGRFVILPWDPDNTFGSINDLPDTDIFLNYERCLVTRMVKDGHLREPFLAKLDEVMQRVPAAMIQQQADTFAAQIRQAAATDTVKMYPTESFEWSLGYIKDWTSARYGSMSVQMAAARHARTGDAVNRGPALAGLALLVACAGACGESDDSGPGPMPCGFDDGEPNDSAGSPTTYDMGAAFDGCVGSASDVDHLQITAPVDTTGGYVTGTIGDVAGGTVRVRVLDGAGTTEIASFVAPGPDMPLTFFLAIAPGRNARIAIGDAGGATAAYTYRLTTTYQPVGDAFEPNDTPEGAAAMPAGTALQAFMFAGAYDGAAAYDDNYRFDAAAEMVTITMTDVPTDMAARIFLFRPDGSEVARVSSGLRGGALTLRSTLPLGREQPPRPGVDVGRSPVIRRRGNHPPRPLHPPVHAHRHAALSRPAHCSRQTGTISTCVRSRRQGAEDRPGPS